MSTADEESHWELGKCQLLPHHHHIVRLRLGEDGKYFSNNEENPKLVGLNYGWEQKEACIMQNDSEEQNSFGLKLEGICHCAW